jgi:hypothetical protein
LHVQLEGYRKAQLLIELQAKHLLILSIVRALMQPGMSEDGDWEFIGKERRDNKAKRHKIIEK